MENKDFELNIDEILADFTGSTGKDGKDYTRMNSNIAVLPEAPGAPFIDPVSEPISDPVIDPDYGNDSEDWETEWKNPFAENYDATSLWQPADDKITHYADRYRSSKQNRKPEIRAQTGDRAKQSEKVLSVPTDLFHKAESSLSLLSSLSPLSSLKGSNKKVRLLKTDTDSNKTDGIMDSPVADPTQKIEIVRNFRRAKLEKQQENRNILNASSTLFKNKQETDRLVSENTKKNSAGMETGQKKQTGRNILKNKKEYAEREERTKREPLLSAVPDPPLIMAGALMTLCCLFFILVFVHPAAGSAATSVTSAGSAKNLISTLSALTLSSSNEINEAVNRTATASGLAGTSGAGTSGAGTSGAGTASAGTASLSGTAGITGSGSDSAGMPVTSAAAGASGTGTENALPAAGVPTTNSAVILSQKVHYTIPESDLVAPAPDAAAYGSVMPDSAAEIDKIIQRAREYGLLGETETTIFHSDTAFRTDTAIQYYLDETILVICWKEIIDGNTCSCSEIKVADASQFRRKFADDAFGSANSYYATDLAKSVNAVTAMNADYYLFRDFGIVVYNRELYRFNEATYSGNYKKYNCVDTCFVTETGDLLYFRKGQETTEEELRQYIADNGILFSVAFGPVLVENGEAVYTDSYPVGEIDKGYSRAGFGQVDTLHYFYMGLNHSNEKQARWNINTYAQHFAEKGVKTAYAFDGGQTGELIMQGKPYNYIDFGAERLVSDIIYFATAIPNGEAVS